MSWDGKLHPRYPAGSKGPNGEALGGKFMPKHLAGTPAWVSAVNAQIAKKQAAAPPKAPAKKAASKKATTAAAIAQGTITALPFNETAAQREQRVLSIIAKNRHLDTDKTEKRGGRWSTARAKMHQQIINDLMKRHQAVPSQRKAIMAGGLIGSGKTSALTGAAGVKAADYISINSDVIKEELAKRGMVPKLSGHPDLSPMDYATLIHQESLHLADKWLARAIARGKNVIFDASMNVPWPTQSRISMFKQGGYTVNGVFIDVPAAVAAQRSTSRYGQAHLDWLNGQGYGGRPIPMHLIMSTSVPARASGRSTTVNRQTFDSLRSSFDEWSVYDNSGATPRLVGTSKRRANSIFATTG